MLRDAFATFDKLKVCFLKSILVVVWKLLKHWSSLIWRNRMDKKCAAKHIWKGGQVKERVAAPPPQTETLIVTLHSYTARHYISCYLHHLHQPTCHKLSFPSIATTVPLFGKDMGEYGKNFRLHRWGFLLLDPLMLDLPLGPPST